MFSGWLILLYLAVALLSGLLVAWDYVPTAARSYESIIGASSVWPRTLHHHASHLCLASCALHVIALLLGGQPAKENGCDTRRWRPRPWLSGVAALLALVTVAYSGRVLPWDVHGGASLVVAEAFLALDPGGLGGLHRILVLHVVLSILLVVTLASHAPWRSRLDDARLPRRVLLFAGGGLALLVLAVALIPAPLGERYHPLALEASRVGAEWYLRWLQLVGLRGGLLAARLLLVILLALAIATPLIARRVGDSRLRWLWLGVAALLVVASMLPSGLGAGSGAG